MIAFIDRNGQLFHIYQLTNAVHAYCTIQHEFVFSMGVVGIIRKNRYVYGDSGKEKGDVGMALRWVLIVGGWLAVLLGFIGVFLPVLPTTPFLLLAASCFAKSSPRFHRWVISSPLFGPIIRDWQDHRFIEKKVKIWAIGVTIVTFSISIYVVPLMAVKYFLVVMLLICLFFMMRLPTRPLLKR
ncbi:YbaN family protein [Gynuella sunshinyii]|uniref:YbaN family protein n=1 Tax=Gynuella sunshinyii TaxID=1445505 RepID=UPI001FE174F9|nr:YbaN family protein [Gynuella sunshinyii]